MRRFTTTAACAIIAGCALPSLAAGHTDMPAAPASSTPTTTAPSMSHAPRAANQAMRVGATVTKDKLSGWNLHVRATGFRWTPQLASTAARQGGGHAHVSIDGVKLGRLYGPWLQLPALGPGKHTVKVELNGNDHRAWTWKGKAVATSVTITEPTPMAKMLMHPHPAIAAAKRLTVGLTVRADAMAGWNLAVRTTGLRLTPWAANTAPVQGTGHMHLYVDGVKIDRLYTRAYHLNTVLTPGRHTVTVGLNANDHSPWSWQGKNVEASQTITVPAT